MSAEVSKVLKGPCALCLNGKEVDIFAVKMPGFAGNICAAHLAVLLKQQEANQVPAPAAKPPVVPTLPPAPRVDTPNKELVKGATG